MSVAALALVAALSGQPQDDADASPRVETRSEIRIVSTGGDGPGRLDADGDGVVTREEFAAPLNTAFDRMDDDDDGRLSREELSAHEGHRDGAPHVMMLEGRDGGFGERFVIRRAGPGGHDGPGEPRIMTFGGPGGRPGDGDVFMFRRPGGPDERPFEIRTFGGPGGHRNMDANGDGRVSEEEFLAPMREAFRSMVSDSDGILAEAERPARPSED